MTYKLLSLLAAALLLFSPALADTTEDDPTDVQIVVEVTLTPGSTGEEVTRLQQQLWQLGYLLTDDVENSVGIFHEETQDAVISAKLAMGYDEPDGVATAEFQCFIFSEYNYFIKK